MNYKRKKIAIFGVKTIPYTGGIEYVINETIPQLDKNKFEFIIYVRKKYFKNTTVPYAKLVCIPHLNNKYLEAPSHTVLSIIHAIFFEKADIFFFHAVVLGAFTIIPKFFLKKVILMTHGLDWKREKWGRISKIIIKFSTYLSIKIPDKTISVGYVDKEFFLKNYNKEVDVLPNGVSKINFNNSLNFLNKYNLEQKKYFLFMARIVPEKGPLLLIKAYLNLPKEIREKYKLVIAGDTNYHDNYYYEVKKFSKEKSICFTGFVSGDQKYTLLKNALCFVQPSSIEGMSIGVLEAMYFGLPIIVSDIPENTYLTNGFGMKFENNNLDDLTKKMYKFVFNQVYYLSQKKDLIKFVQNNFMWRNTVKRLENILHNL